MIDDFSSKVDLSSALETVVSIDADHIQMVKCTDRDDVRYRTILSVLKQCIHPGCLGTILNVLARSQSPLNCGEATKQTVSIGAKNDTDR